MSKALHASVQGGRLQVIWEQCWPPSLGKRFIWFFTTSLALKTYKWIKIRYKYIYVFKGSKKKNNRFLERGGF